MKEVFNMNDNEKKYFELEKEYRSELKKLNNKKNFIIAGAVVIFFIISLFLLHCKKYNCFIISISLFFASYAWFHFSYEKPLKNNLKEKVKRKFVKKNKIQDLINFEEYLEDKINKKITILDLTSGQAYLSSFIVCALGGIDKSFNDKGCFFFNYSAFHTYLSIFLIASAVIFFLEKYNITVYNRKVLSKKLIKIIDKMIAEEYENNN